MPFFNSNEIVLLCFSNRFGAKYRSTRTGIIYNNEMADFDIPGDKRVDGISPSPVNFPEKGKRPLSSMCPTILTDNSGIVRLVIGASGGKRITTAVSLVRPIVFFVLSTFLESYNLIIIGISVINIVVGFRVGAPPNFIHRGGGKIAEKQKDKNLLYLYCAPGNPMELLLFSYGISRKTDPG